MGKHVRCFRGRERVEEGFAIDPLGIPSPIEQRRPVEPATSGVVDAHQMRMRVGLRHAPRKLLVGFRISGNQLDRNF